MPETLKDIINNLIKNNSSILQFIDETEEDYQDGKEVIPLYADTLVKTQYNPALGLGFANVLQLSDNEEFYNQYELEDIGRLYSSLIELQDGNLDAYIEAANFKFAVLDKTDIAKQIATAGIEKAMQKVEELKKLLDLIAKEEDGA
jgi:hypothetical protein